MKHLFGLFILLFCLFKISNSVDPYCIYQGVGDGYNYYANASALAKYPAVNMVGSMDNFMISYCDQTVACGPYSDALICGTIEGKLFLMAQKTINGFDYSTNGLKKTYISNGTGHTTFCSTSYNTTTLFQCNLDPNDLIVKVTIDYSGGCNYNFIYSSNLFCQRCPKCILAHGSCNSINGWCTCDSYTQGLNCDQLKATISSIINPTFNGGQITISGDFSSIYNIRSDISIAIGSLQCLGISFTNTSEITCNIGAGQGSQNLVMSDNKGASLNYIGFYYRIPCTVDCTSPWGSCNDTIGSCVCQSQATGTDCKTLNLQLTTVSSTTFVSGGQVSLIGDFSKVKDLLLTIKIGNIQCTNQTFNNDFTILDCIIGSGEGIKDILITFDKLSFLKENAFEYQYYTCPYNCSFPSGQCNRYNGSCTCDDVNIGEGCEFKLCPLNCSPPFGVCNNITGICSCDSQTTGNGCELKLCPLNCSPPHGVCNNITGICACNDQNIGNGCQFKQCPLNCSPPHGDCNNITGVCTCDQFYFGDGCQNITFKECPDSKCSNHGTCDTTIGSCICDTQTKGLGCEQSRLIIESVDPTKTDGGRTTIIGYFGVPTSKLSIKIGDLQCTNIKVLNETTLDCDIGAGEGTHNVTITDNDLSYTAINMFEYVGQIEPSKISGASVAGIAIGSFVGVSIVGAGGYYQYKRNKKIELFM
ncbi:hypothetical protein RB653_006370 [Dictyostelium firmibasis]|uniref:EGF-like domain-containing protein n=1 Tax=Dictyostelium firmibasis TaxID=79012 RepID=A0AAN7U8T6_9MYCE